MSRPALTRIDMAILGIIDRLDDEIAGRDLRRLLKSLGFRRSAPAFIFTMLHLEDKGLVCSREEQRIVDGVESNERFYRRTSELD
jgi:hypothetical protein